MSFTLLLSCEHAGNVIPPDYQRFFKNADAVLQSHRGWDPGAWKVAQFLSAELGIPLLGCHTSRLLIEANRSIDSTHLFSEYTNHLPGDEKDRLLRTIYFPYRDAIEKAIRNSHKPVVHLSIHSFTPIWDEKPRKTDIGLLFDAARGMETEVCQKMQDVLTDLLPGHSIAFNDPYKGTDDGFTTYLRKFYPDGEYAGVEIEINQKYESALAPIQIALQQAIQSLLFA